MMRSWIIMTWPFIAVLIMPVGNAIAQIDHRVDHRVDHRIDRGDGHLLDSNPQVGSGGHNQSRSTSFDFGRHSNAIVTGNVTGLARFHVSSPVLQTNQFRGSLPSGGLSGFLSQSIGLSQIRSNQSSRSTLYFGRQETVPDLRFIRNRLNQPGSSLLKTPLIRPPSIQEYTVRNERPNIPDPADLRLDLTPDLSRIGVTQRSLITNQSAIGAQSILSLPFSSAARSSLFGLPEPEKIPFKSTARGSHSEYIRPILRSSDLTSRYNNSIGGAPTINRPPQRPDLIINQTIGQRPGRDSRYPTRRSIQTTGVGTTPTASARQRDNVPILPGGITSANDFTVPSADFGGDRFSDFSRVVAIAQQLRIRRLGMGLRNRPIQGPIHPQSQIEHRQRSETPGQFKQRDDEPIISTDSGIAELAVAAKWANKLLADPVQSFVGKYENRLNQYLSAGEDEMHQGRFYKAASQFDMAHLVDPSNPLPLLGKGHALIAAGDYLSGFLSLTRGISQFPQIAAFRLDLPAMVDQHDVFDVCRADLEQRLAVEEYYDLRFLLGYLELYSGLVEEGIHDLERAAKQAPRDSVIVIFPDLIMGQRELPELGKTRH